jgi:hypothetical protein
MSMTRIEAEVAGFNERVFSSPEAAIAHGRILAQQQWIKDIQARVSGRRIIGASWTDKSLIMAIDSGESLIYAWGDDRMKLELPANAPESSNGPSEAIDPEIVIAVGEREFVWNRSAIIARIIGRRIFAVSVGNEFGSMSTYGGVELCVTTLINRATCERFLHWGPIAE